MERNRGRSPVTLLLSITVGCGVLAVIGLVWWDRPIAAWIESLPRQRAIWTEALTLLDLATLKHISNFLLGVLLLLASCLAWLIPVARRHVRPLFYLGMVQFMTTVVADLSKPIFGRLRPFEAFERTNGADTWFISANSFPSGHAAFYAG